jgi:hypothetical protein
MTYATVRGERQSVREHALPCVLCFSYRLLCIHVAVSRRVQFATLAARHEIPAIYTVREQAEASEADELWGR